MILHPYRALTRSRVVWLAFGLLLSLAGGCGPPGTESAQVRESLARITVIAESREATAEDLRFLEERLERGGPEERSVAAWALGKVGTGPDHLSLLLEKSREDPDVGVRMNAIVALGDLGGDGIEAILVGFLSDEDPEIRGGALRGLNDKRYAGAWGAVGEVLLHGDDDLRPVAADVLATLENVESLTILEGAAGDPNKKVRSLVAFAMGKIRHPRAAPALTRMIEDDAWEVRANATQALGMIGDPRARSSLERMLDDPNGQVRIAAELALGKLD